MPQSNRKLKTFPSLFYLNSLSISVFHCDCKSKQRLHGCWECVKYSYITIRPPGPPGLFVCRTSQGHSHVSLMALGSLFPGAKSQASPGCKVVVQGKGGVCESGCCEESGHALRFVNVPPLGSFCALQHFLYSSRTSVIGHQFRPKLIQTRE